MDTADYTSAFQPSLCCTLATVRHGSTQMRKGEVVQCQRLPNTHASFMQWLAHERRHPETGHWIPYDPTPRQSLQGQQRCALCLSLQEILW